MMCLLSLEKSEAAISLWDIIGKTMHGLVCGTGRSSFFIRYL